MPCSPDSRRFPVSLLLTRKEDEALRALASQQDMSLNGIMVQALRLYQLHHSRLKAGETVVWSGDAARQAEFVSGIVE